MEKEGAQATGLARLGGDEFTAVLTDVSRAAVLACAEACVRAVAAPLSLAGQRLTLSVSVSAAFSAAPGQRPAELLRAADVALYQAKAAGRGRAVLFDPSQHAPVAAPMPPLRLVR